MMLKKKQPIIKIVFVFVFFIVLIGGLNTWVQQQALSVVNDRDSKTVKVAVVNNKVKETVQRDSKDMVVRRTHVVRGDDFVESFFYLNDKEIARVKEVHGEIVEQTGEIPDGKVKFFDSYKRTYGEEYYEKEKREGRMRTYFETGELLSEANYDSGKLISKREYYADGTLRFEVDHTNVPLYLKGKEVGVGKLYYQNGNMKYEWRMTNNDREGFKKSYNQDGSLRYAAYFDQTGHLIREQR